MTRTASIPAALAKGPFTLDEARSAGLTDSALKGKAWRRLGSGIYRWENANADPWLLVAAWRRELGRHVTFGGFTAAWLHGVNCAPTSPIEVIAPLTSPTRSCFGLVVRHCDLLENEVVTMRSVRTTSIARTLRDLCVTKVPVEVLVIVDAALRHRLVDLAHLSRYVQQVSGLPGAARLRKLISLAAPAESPMETRLRWLLVSEGLPKPEVQKDLLDAEGELLGRADLYYASAGLVVEFDGGNHKERLVSDDRRQNRLIEAGYRILRFTSPDVFLKPDTVVSQVRGALTSVTGSARFAQNVRNASAVNARFG